MGKALAPVKIYKTSVALATERSGYVWLRAPVMPIPSFDSILTGILKEIVVGFHIKEHTLI